MCHPAHLRRAIAALTVALALAACAGPRPAATPTPPALPTAILRPSPTPPAASPTIALPSPAPQPPSPAPPPPSPTIALPGPTPLPPTPVAAPGRPPVAAFFFYWYHCPRRECDATQLTVVPPGWLAPLPGDPDPRDGTAYSSLNYDWYEGELRDMAATGVDMIFPVSWGDHPHFWFRQETLGRLVQANGILDRPLPIGLFLDTTAQQGMYSDFVGDSYRYGPEAPRLPLSDPRSGFFFYDRHIKGFYQRIPREMWATHQGRPIIVTYTALCCDDLALAGPLWAAVKAAFARDFGVEPWLILEDTWFTPAALSPPDDLDPVDQIADGRYAWGTALNGHAARELRGFTTSSVGPGFDNSRINGIADPRQRPREDGAFLRQSLAAVPPEADILFIETWNEWPESSGIARASYTDGAGNPLPEDFYMRILRDWKEGR